MSLHLDKVCSVLRGILKGLVDGSDFVAHARRLLNNVIVNLPQNPVYQLLAFYDEVLVEFIALY